MGNLKSGRVSASAGRIRLLGLGALLALSAVGCGDTPMAEPGKKTDTKSDGGSSSQTVGDAGAADSGALACSCKATWEVDNLVACWEEPTDTTPATPYSSHFEDGADIPSCDEWQGTFPHTTPSQPWSKNRLTGTCTGTATLCLTIKQGSVDAPKSSDCVLATLCSEKPVSYDVANKAMELPDLPGWAAQDEQCAKDFYEKGGYFEMVAKDYSLGDCKSGDEALLGRVPFCPVKCSQTPNLPECKKCGDGTAKIEF